MSDKQYLINLRNRIRESKDSRASYLQINNEDSLTSFNLKSQEDKVKNFEKTFKWIYPNEQIEINEVIIEGGFFYYGSFISNTSEYQEPSLVNSSLKINLINPDYAGDELVNWLPNYREMTPRARSAYIRWLASDRSDQDINIRFVYLYVCGIERRLLYDFPRGNMKLDEFQSLVAELKRLKKFYGSDNGFNSRVLKLLSYLWILSHKNEKLPELEKLDEAYVLEKVYYTNEWYPLAFSYYLSRFVHEKGRIYHDLALKWILLNSNIFLRTPAIRCKEEFSKLFAILFKQQYSDGLNVELDTGILKLSYYSNNQSIQREWEPFLMTFQFPDATQKTDVVNSIMIIVNEATDMLDSYSRFLGKNGDKDSIEASSLLPNEIFASVNNEKVESIRIWLRVNVIDKNFTCKVLNLLEQFKDEAPIKINKKEAEFIANILEKLGYGIAPDIRYHAAKPDLDGYCVIFKVGHDKHFEPSSDFKQLCTIISLGAIVASSDNHIHDLEIDALKNIIINESDISDIEKDSLIAYMHWRLNEPLNTTGLKARINELSQRQKDMLKSILITVALADGKIMPVEIKQIEKLYILLGFDKSEVTSDIHNLSFNSLHVDKNQSAKVSLNRNLLYVYEQETVDVKSILERIFVDDDIDESEVEEDTLEIIENIDNANLDSLHNQFYQLLITKEAWVFDDVKQICDELNLMISGAIETINDWSFELVDAAVIDEDDVMIYVDMEVVEEINAIN